MGIPVEKTVEDDVAKRLQEVSDDDDDVAMNSSCIHCGRMVRL